MEQKIGQYKTVIHKLKKTKLFKIISDFSIALFNALFITIIAATLLVSIEMIVNGDKSFRLVLFSSLFLTFFSFFFFFSLPTLFLLTSKKRKLTLDKLAFNIGYYYPDIKDRLSNSIQLYNYYSKTDGISRTFIQKSIESITEKVKDYDFSVVINKIKLRNSFIRFILSLFLFSFLSFIFSNSFGYAFYRIINFNKSFIPPPPFSLIIYPKYETVKKGENVRIIVKAQGTSPQTITLKIKEFQQEDYESIPLNIDSANTFIYQFPSIKNSIKFFAEAEWMTEKVSSDIGEIVVIDNPIVKTIQGNVVFPSYTKKPPIYFTEQNADLNVLAGSQINLSILANKKIKKAKIYLLKEKKSNNDLFAYDTTKIEINSKDNKAFGSFTANFNGFYFIQIQDYDNLEILNPIQYRLNIFSDGFPEIKLLEPETDVKLTEVAMLPMMIFISDDYGFSSLTLKYRLSYSNYTQPWKEYKSLSIPVPHDKTEANIAYIWDLNTLQISPSEEYEFYLEVYDNDRVSGPKSAKTPIFRAKLPSLDEVLKETAKSQESIVKELDKVLKEANDIKKEMENINRELSKNLTKNQLDWSEKKKAENLLNKQKELSNKLSEIQKNLEDLTKKMTENNLLSPETLQKYLELQKLLQEVNSPELRRLQQQLEQALQKLSPEDIKKALENYKFDEEQFRKNLERTINILKRLQAEQKADALQKLAEELLRKQEDLQKQLENANPNDKNLRDKLESQQEQIRKDLNTIDNELKKLSDLMKEIGKDMPLDELNRAANELSPNETNQDMQDAENSIQSGNFNKARQSQEKAKSRLKKFAEQMKKVRDEINKRVTKEAIEKLEKAVNDMMTLSKEQTELKKETQSTDYNSARIPEQARTQANLAESLLELANSLFELSQKSFSVTPEMAREIGSALNSMQNAVESLADRNLSRAKEYQDQAIQAMNRASIQMQNMLSQLQNQGSCENPGGMGENGKGSSFNFMQRLQQIASSQQTINQMAQQLANQNQGQLTQEQQAQLARIIADQGRAQKALEELANEQKRFGQQDPRILGSLNKIVQEMQEVISDLQSGKITPETLKRQERILSRLLDATKSVYERDYEERRESTPGKELAKESPNQLDPRIINKKSFEQYLNELKLKYTKDYEEIIRKYFNLIQNSELSQ
ncbi:MAG: DUF4175 family protein [Ignavibacteria bacterium]|nr:DUF4175 family protein [Ignavibacteria bacterium]